MKKIYIIFTLLIALSSTILITGCVLNEPTSFDKEEQIFSIKTNYTYNTNSEKYIEVLLYSNNPKSYLKVYKDENVVFTNKDSTRVIAGSIHEVKLIKTDEYYDQKVYGYKLYIKPENFNSNFIIDNCYIQTIDFRCEIGTLGIMKVEEKDSYLDYSKIHAIGNENFGFKTINGFAVTFTNKSLTSITISDFNIGPFNYASLYYATIAPNDLSYSTPLEDVIGEYDPLNFDETKGSIVIPANRSVTYVIPVFYYDVSFLGNTLIYINNELYIENFDYIVNYDNLSIYEEIILEASLYNVE